MLILAILTALFPVIVSLTVIFWLPLFAVTGLLILGREGWIAYRSRWTPDFLVAFLLIAGSSIAYIPLVHAADEVAFQVRWWKQSAAYVDIVDQINRGGEIGGDIAAPIHLDEGPPIRIAFAQPGRFLDNWEAVVYDPSGRVGHARGYSDHDRGEFTAPPEIKALFGGDLLQCEELREPHFFRCWFT